MQEVMVFTKKEYEQLKKLLDEIRGDIWDISDPADRVVLSEDLHKLEVALGFLEC